MARSTKSAAGHSLASAKSARFRHELQRSASHWPGRLVDLQFAVPDFAPGCSAATIIDHVAVRLHVVSEDVCDVYVPASFSAGLVHFWHDAIENRASR
jgi:hypothetical protein